MLTLSDALDLFLLEDRAPSTRETYRKVLTKALMYFRPSTPLAEVNREDILRYIEHLRQQPARYANHPRRATEQGGLSPKTVEKNVKTLVTFFRWAQQQGFRETNPAVNLKLRRYQRPPGSSKAATPEELKAILEVAKAKAVLGKPLHLGILLFVADTGARAGEAASLTVGNLNLDTLDAWVIGKGDVMRPLFFCDITAQALRDVLAQMPECTPDTSVFGMTADSLSQVINRMAREAGIKRPIGSHAVRHRVGQVWSGARLGERATQMKLGHEDPAVTIEMYYNTTWDHIRQASQELGLAAIYGVPTEPERLKPAGNVIRYPGAKTGS